MVVVVDSEEADANKRENNFIKLFIMSLAPVLLFFFHMINILLVIVNNPYFLARTCTRQVQVLFKLSLSTFSFKLLV